ncbi:catalase [Anaerolentibacter hominis]|uniref:catalase n=1 Tax=Anaerolentibacter hominis TaxID=3079009 RepID=UPI0031B819B9
MQYSDMPNEQEAAVSFSPDHSGSDSPSCTSFSEKDHSLTVGPDGPVLLQDTILHETLETFVNEKIIERAVHTKGYGAFGYFTAYRSMSQFTKASFLQAPGQQTYTFSRFSLAVSNRGTPDTSRNVRGFSTKFYTDEGNFDLLTNHIPVFLVRDAMQFPSAIKSLSPSPLNNLPDPEAFWKFAAAHPEATHFITWLYSDLGTIDSLRHIRTYGVNTYTWVNEAGEKHYVKYHLLPMAGERSITREEAIKLAGENPDIAGEDLYRTLAQGIPVEYELHVQLMEPSEAADLPFDPLDDTKVWDEEAYPLIQVGLLTLDANVDDYQNQVEKAAFSPANLIDGIELSNDKMLQGRSFIYWDAQRRRIGPDFRTVPVNYEENWSPKTEITTGLGEKADGIIQRSEIPDQDNFIQAGEHYLSLDQTQRDHLAENLAADLSLVTDERILTCVLSYLYAANNELGYSVAQRLNRNQDI